MTDANWNADLDFDDVVRATMTDADKLVEEIAQGAYERMQKRLCAKYDMSECPWDEAAPAAQESFIDDARTALALAVERCAVAVEDAGGDNAEYHAEKVRSLSPNAKGESDARN